MATDRFIYLTEETDRTDVASHVWHYLHGDADGGAHRMDKGPIGDIEFDDDRLFVNFPGKVWCFNEFRQRWMEVYVGKGLHPGYAGMVDVITRDQDTFVCAVADGLVSYLLDSYTGAKRGV